jgi:uncharacterized protein (TIGR01732 family)
MYANSPVNAPMANAPMYGGGYGGYCCGYGGAGKGFAIIVVLFILLIIVGAAWAHKGDC